MTGESYFLISPRGKKEGSVVTESVVSFADIWRTAPASGAGGSPVHTIEPNSLLLGAEGGEGGEVMMGGVSCLWWGSMEGTHIHSESIKGGPCF